MSIVLVGAIFYISTLLSSPSSPTQIQKTKAAAVTYSRTVDLPEFGGTDETPSPTVTEPTTVPTLLAKAPIISPTTIPPTTIPTRLPTKVPTIPPLEPTEVPPTDIPTPTLSPLLAYKSTSGITPTLIPIGETGGMQNPPHSLVPTKSTKKETVPTGVKQLPESGWIQTSTILFIVSTSTILFSLLF